MFVNRLSTLSAALILSAAAGFGQTQINNLGTTDSVINFSSVNSVCVDTYVFDTASHMLACCSSLIQAQQQYSLSAQKDLISNLITPSAPTSIVVKVSGSAPFANSCNPASPHGVAPDLTTSIGPAPGATGIPFPQAAATSAELALCSFIQANASGFGICQPAHALNSSSTPASLAITLAHSGDFGQGDFGDTYTATVKNSLAAGPTSGAVSVTETLPAGLSLAFMGGTGWSCSGPACSRSDVLNPGSSYPPINIVVNVAVDAASPQVNKVTVSGGGSASTAATDATGINVTAVRDPGTQINNLNTTDTIVNFSSSAAVCLNTYVLDLSHNVLECCSSLVPASQAYYYSTQKDLISNTLAPSAPASIFLKVSATVPNGAVCDPAAPGDLTTSLTTSLGTSPGGPGTPLVQTPPSQHDVTSCQFVKVNGSGFGICRPARAVSGTPAPSLLSISSTHRGSFFQGDIGDTYTLTVNNSPSAGATIGTVTVTESVPAGLTLVSMNGSGWACSGSSCSRSDSVNPGSGYAPITVVVNVAKDAISPLLNQVSVSGGGSVSSTTTDSTGVLQSIPGSAATPVNNLDTTDSVVNMFSTSKVCVNTYVLDTSHNLLECCSSLVPAAQAYYLSARNQLISNPLNPTTPSSVLLKVFASLPNGTQCDPANPGNLSFDLATTLGPAAGAPGVPLAQATPNATELGQCQFIEANGSGFGICGQARAFAVSGVSYSAGTAQGTPGQAVEIPIQITAASTPPTNFQVDLSYDTNLLTFVSSRKGAQLTAAGDDVSSVAQPNTDIRLTATGSGAGSITTGTLAYASFRLNTGFTSGSSAITLKNCLATVAGQPLSAGCAAGSITGASVPPKLSVTKTHSGNFTQGQNGALYNVIVTNDASGSPTSGLVTVTETVPSGLALTSMSGLGWTCAGTTCTRSDVLNAGASYPVIVVTVGVSATAASPQVNTVKVSGGGSADASASDSTVVALAGPSIILPPSLSLSPGDQIPFPVSLSKTGSGVFVTLSVSDASVASLNTTGVIIAEGDTTSSRVRLNGLSNGSVTVTGTASGYAAASTLVTVGTGGGTGGGGGGGGGGTTGTIILPAGITLHAGEQAVFPVTLGGAPPTDGVFITLTVSDPQVISLNTTGVIIPAGDTSSIRIRVNGIGAGTATVTASAQGYASVSQQVVVAP